MQKLHKRHNFLSFHRVRESIVVKILKFNFLPGTMNLADILSKHWGHHHIKISLQTLLFYKGETADLFDEEEMYSTN